MAIYHLEAKIITRSTGRSAVAAAAYMSCSKVLNDYDGVLHDFTRKRGLEWQHIFLPANAPAEWQDRSALWNAVEAAEQTKDSRLARELVVALPTELNKTERINLLTEFVKTNFVAEGMCADVAIHNTDGHNPHAHILLTVRPLDEKGKWQKKTEKEYLCVRGGMEKGLTSSEFATAKAEGWEKQYPYFIGNKKEYLPPSEAQEMGYERASKYPKSTRFGRQNPTAARWNSEEQLNIWRASWAAMTNRYLDNTGKAIPHIDHRSHKERGLEEQPTIHEGLAARRMEKAGFVSERCEINRRIKADNALLCELKETVRKLSAIVKMTLKELAEAMESLRQTALIFSYHLVDSQFKQYAIKNETKGIKKGFETIKAVVSNLKDKTKQRTDLLSVKKETPVIQVMKHRELSRRIAALSEEIEELKTEKESLLVSLECASESDFPRVQKRLERLEETLKQCEREEAKYKKELEKLSAEYALYKEQAKAFNTGEFDAERLKYRKQKENEAMQKLKDTCGKDFDRDTFLSSVRDVDYYLDDTIDEAAVRHYRAEQRRQNRQTERSKSIEELNGYLK
ncbi:MAG: MobA/MobL family protein [Clostridia bacterium]|nr:MobA/MobL family protein [Clostridia bacterium]